jgi:hypothetical protein
VSLQYVIGIDHAVVMVKDLDAAAANWQRLGFTLSPRGTHSPALGSGNYTIMFGHDYIELLGILNPTEHNAPRRLRQARAEAQEAAGVRGELEAHGVAGQRDRRSARETLDRELLRRLVASGGKEQDGDEDEDVAAAHGVPG